VPMYVYQRSGLEMIWTVGFYKPNGEWVAESDWITPDEAAERAAWLNGSIAPFDSRERFVESLQALCRAVRQLN